MNRRRAPLAVATSAVFAVGMSLTVFATPAVAQVTSIFELDGNVLDEAASSNPDWGAGEDTSIFTLPAGYDVTSTDPTLNKPQPRSPLPGSFFDAGFSVDFIPGSTGDTSSFTGGGSKDIYDVSSWKCKEVSNQTDKGDIQNAYAAVASDPVTGNLLLYFGMEKNAPNGNNNMGVWFLQDGTVGCDGTGVGGNGQQFTGNHVDGDVFLVAAFTNGGANPTITAFKWNAGALVQVDTGGKCGDGVSDDLCAITNDTSSVTTPWQTTNKGSTSPQNKTGQGNTLDADQFYEGAIDLTANGLDKDPVTNEPICVNRFVFNTRSSQETTATLYDYAAGDVQTCANPSLSTLLYKAGTTDTALPADGNHTVTLPASVYDTATLTGGFPVSDGTITYSLWTDSTCETASTDPKFGNGTNEYTVNIAANGSIPNSETIQFTAADSYWWQAHYTPGPTSRNNPATSDCTEEPLVVQPRSPSISTEAAAASDDAGTSGISITVGESRDFYDTAKIENGYFPASGTPAPGSVTFKLYGPFDNAPDSTMCTAANEISVSGSTVAATRDGNDTTAKATGPSYTPTTIGWYQWTAKYNGNAQNDATSFFGCGDPKEQVQVTPATPGIATTMMLSDKVKVSGITGAGDPKGNVVFSLWASDNCTGEQWYDSGDVALGADGTAQSAAVAVAAGTYSWKVVFTPDTSASGNPNYTGVMTTCDPASDETAVIGYGGDSPISPTPTPLVTATP